MLTRSAPTRPARRRSPRACRLLEPGDLPLGGVVLGNERNGAAPISSATGATHSSRLSIRARAGTGSPRSKSSSSPDMPQRIARHMFSSSMRCGRFGSGSPSSCARSAACRERVAERGERLRLGEVGLRVGDADLDRRVREVRAHAPPDLRVLGDRARAVEERDVVLERAASRRTRPGSRSAGTCA